MLAWLLSVAMGHECPSDCSICNIFTTTPSHTHWIARDGDDLEYEIETQMEGVSSFAHSHIPNVPKIFLSN